MSKTVTISDEAYEVLRAIKLLTDATPKQTVDAMITKYLAEHLELLVGVAAVTQPIRRPPYDFSKFWRTIGSAVVPPHTNDLSPYPMSFALM